MVALVGSGRCCSIWRSRAFISSRVRRRCARTAPVAGHGGQDFMAGAGHQGAGLVLVQLGQHAAASSTASPCAKRAGTARTARVLGENGTTSSPKVAKVALCASAAGHFLRGGGKGGGNQQGLAGNGLVVAHLGLQALVHDALVRGVHIDDDHALGVFRQDVNAVDLRHGAAQRPVLGRGRCWRCARLRPRELCAAGAVVAAGWLSGTCHAGWRAGFAQRCPQGLHVCGGQRCGRRRRCRSGESRANAEGAAADKGMANCCGGVLWALAGAGWGAASGTLAWAASQLGTGHGQGIFDGVLVWLGGLRGCRESALQSWWGGRSHPPAAGQCGRTAHKWAACGHAARLHRRPWRRAG